MKLSSKSPRFQCPLFENLRSAVGINEGPVLADFRRSRSYIYYQFYVSLVLAKRLKNYNLHTLTYTRREKTISSLTTRIFKNGESRQFAFPKNFA
jgi:hypothetical protein